MNNVYSMPEFLLKKCKPEVYEKWLDRKTKALIKRDRKRWDIKATPKDYKQEIHRAVIESKGFDGYTGKKLNWSLIGKYNNDESKIGGSKYKEEFADLPTVDHVDVKNKCYEFKICSWKVNDAKNDLDYKEFLKLCKDVIAFAEKEK